MKFTERTIGGMLHDLADRYGDKEGLVCPQMNQRYSYKQLDSEVDDLSCALLEMGVKKGDKVGILAGNSPQWLIIMFAIQRIGAVCVTINTMLRKPELEYVLLKADVSTLFISEEFRGMDYISLICDIIPEIEEKPRGSWKSKAFPYMKNVITISDTAHRGMYCTSELFLQGSKCKRRKLRMAEQKVGSRDMAAIQFTSGTTGFPKGVMLSHFGIVNNALTISENLRITEEDRYANCLPLFHGSSCFTQTLMNLFAGSTLVLITFYHPKVVLSVIQNEKCTMTAGVPTMFINELSQPDFDKYDLSHLNRAVMFGAVCPPEAMKQVMERMHCLIISVYGTTELSPCTCMTSFDDSLEARLTSIGKPFFGTEQVVIDPLTGEPCECGQKGELLVRGYNIMLGYYKDAEATARAIDENGFYHTGDAVTQDEEGNYHVIGRVNDMIIHGGDNIYPSEVENVIDKIPEVKSVEVLGLPSPVYGEQVSAFIIVRDGYTLSKQDVVRYCRERIAAYKIPKYIFFVDSYPLTATGKVQKSQLRTLGLEILEKNGEKVA